MNRTQLGAILSLFYHKTEKIRTRLAHNLSLCLPSLCFFILSLMIFITPLYIRRGNVCSKVSIMKLDRCCQVEQDVSFQWECGPMIYGSIVTIIIGILDAMFRSQHRQDSYFRHRFRTHSGVRSVITMNFFSGLLATIICQRLEFL